MSRFKAFIMCSLTIAISGCGVSSSADTQGMVVARGGQQSAVIVELFTSQGCSSCPPADRVLAELKEWAIEEQAPVLCLSFHVDYWNQLGWTDPYSSQAFSARQSAYAAAAEENGVYTPQVIVNGQHAFVGSESDKAFRVVKNELAADALPVNIKLDTTGDFQRDQVTVIYNVDGQPVGSVLNFAVVSKQARNIVPRGENAGLDSTHVNVVRAFKTVNLRDGAEGEIKFELPPRVEPKNCDIIAYVQDERLRVLGASSLSVGDSEK
ncbi:MAG: DUF1223 domain-containing protein [Bythopirellula sp.]|nr:DUF1223 domain-containing protein [Bythopirellula sp.]